MALTDRKWADTPKRQNGHVRTFKNADKKRTKRAFRLYSSLSAGRVGRTWNDYMQKMN
jgi:hypothetical protein